MPDLTPQGTSWVQQLRQKAPKLSGLSDTELLKAYLDEVAKNPHPDDPSTPDIHEDDPAVWESQMAQKAGLPEGGFLHSALAGAWDGINPTPWLRPEERIGDWPKTRMLGNAAGTLGTFALAPLAAAKVAKGIGLGVKGAMALDLGYRGAVGASSGYHDIERLAAEQGVPLDTGAAVTSALSGAGGMMMPLDFAPSSVTSTLARKGINAAGMGLAGLGSMAGMTSGVAQQLDRPFSDIASAEVEGLKKNPGSLGMIGGMVAAPLLLPSGPNHGFHFSTAGPTLEKILGKVRIDPQTPAAMPSTGLGRTTGPSMANVPPPQSPLTRAATPEAIAKALSAEGMDLGDIGPSGSFDSDAIRKQLDTVAFLRNLRSGVNDDLRVSQYQGDIYSDPIPGVFDTRQKIWGSAGGDVLVGPTIEAAKRINSGDFYGTGNKIMRLGEQNLLMPPGFSPLSSGRAYPDMLPESLATSLGIGRDVNAYAKGPGGQFLVADKMGGPTPKGYQVPIEALPTYGAQEKAWAAQREADEAAKGISKDAAMRANAGKLNVQDFDPAAEIQKILDAIPEHLRGYFTGGGS